MAIPANEFSITAKLWADPKQVGKKANIKVPLVADADKDEDAFWVSALACSKEMQEKVEELNLKKFDMVEVKGKLLPPNIFKDRAYLTMWLNDISMFEEKPTESQVEANVQEESTSEDDIPF